MGSEPQFSVFTNFLPFKVNREALLPFSFHLFFHPFIFPISFLFLSVVPLSLASCVFGSLLQWHSYYRFFFIGEEWKRKETYSAPGMWDQWDNSFALPKLIILLALCKSLHPSHSLTWYVFQPDGRKDEQNPKTLTPAPGMAKGTVGRWWKKTQPWV